MTVEELKEKLSTIPENLEIIIHGYNTMPGFYKISHYMENYIPTNMKEFNEYVEKLTDNELIDWAIACNKLHEEGEFVCNSLYKGIHLKISEDMCRIIADELMKRIANFDFDGELYTNRFLSVIYGWE